MVPPVLQGTASKDQRCEYQRENQGEQLYRRRGAQHQSDRRTHQGNQHHQADQDPKHVCTHLKTAVQNPVGQWEEED